MTLRDQFIINDLRIMDEIFLRNVYRLPDKFEPDDYIIDVGAHIGAFTLACWLRGSRKIVAVEAEMANANLLDDNLKRLTGTHWHRRAVWESGQGSIAIGLAIDDQNPAGHSIARRQDRPEDPLVRTIGLDELLAQYGCPCAFLKIDAESAEFPILFTSKNLGMVKRLAVEYHTEPLRPEAGCEANVLALIDHLKCNFNTVEISNQFKHDIYERGMIHASSE